METRIQQLVRELLVELGEDPEREGLRRTPSRMDNAYRYLTKGYKADLKTILNDAIFYEECNEMVIVRNIEYYSLCEHHLLPFYGQCHVAYLPNKKIIGLSKIPRIVDMYSRRLQVQERLTNQIANTLWEVLEPFGVAVVMDGKHLCMMMRGVEKQNSLMTSSAMLGAFQKERMTRMEFLSLINKRE
ncbi:MAG TPA: GTP cyclohydrolase I FolE [bacterium]|mgnify:CR=1 FL=1|jgi:GTP cyclohydrolase I|nr:GTP cyclohydrolase I FolE [bacterium]HNT64501.1 GTP cyclohydrolase I FolE [bacterium]HOX84654.1 GTP cyclohydrolase I FolE [bacterium]HPG45377.1 GTP cyclohydrolase I FolE [bacterium]HPM96847.1 GTP cyclohydrolase I FolE [bacterium]